jgi:hypothetical protein
LQWTAVSAIQASSALLFYPENWFYHYTFVAHVEVTKRFFSPINAVLAFQY